MTTLARLNATTPAPLNKSADMRVESSNFGTKNEYIRHLIRQDLETTKKHDIQLLNKMLQDGMDSGVSAKTPEEIAQSARSAIEKAVSKNN